MNIPSGSVTFLFTDIEGSTSLAQEFPDSLPSALEKHHAILTETIESNNGFVFEIVGDAFCCAFEKAEDAVKAAVDAQLNLANEKWDNAVIRIRIGIHSGDAEWNGKKYRGYITLARTARVMSAAYGEQIIISNDAYISAKEKIPDKISFRDLGERRLKDLKHPLRLYQIISKGLVSDFPPLKTLEARPNNLPIQLTSFIGREDEMKQVKDLLKQTHLLTLTGSGGVGKTRLAMQIAADVIDDFDHGVWIAELSPVFEPEILPNVIMKVLGLMEEPNRNTGDTLCDYLKDKKLLIILDNCEQLVDHCAALAEKLLRNSPGLKIIATSREALRCAGEQTHNVLSLNVPVPGVENSIEKLAQFEAVRLFIETAMAVDSEFRINKNNAPAIAAICYQLDGIPLAIELAAARIKILSAEKIHERLGDRFNLLTGGKRTALPRQKTLKALVDWSYDLLTEEEKILWRRLSVFSGGWTMEAAEEVCSDQNFKKEGMLELLNQLTSKSIIIYERENERYRILETLKQYGKDKLKEAKETEEILSKHLNYFMGLAEAAEQKLYGKDAQVWIEKLESDHVNLQSGIDWSLSGGDREKGIRLAESLWYFWDIRGHYSIGIILMQKFLDNAQDMSKSSLRKLLSRTGALTSNRGEFVNAVNFLEAGLKSSREINDKHNISFTLSRLGMTEQSRGNFEKAQKYHEESLALSRDSGKISESGDTLSQMGRLAYDRGNYDEAHKFYTKSLDLLRETGDKSRIAFSLNGLGIVAFKRGYYEQAEKFFNESLDLRREVGDIKGIAGSLGNLGNLTSDLGNYEQSQKYQEEALLLYRKIGDKRGTSNSLYNFGNLLNYLGNYEQAQSYFEESLILYREMGDKYSIAYSLYGLALLLLDRGDIEKARKLNEESLLLQLEIGDKSLIYHIIIEFACIFNLINLLPISVKLLGAVELNLKSNSVVLESKEQTRQEHIIKSLREKLSDEEFLKYFEEGKKLTIEEAAQLAVNNARRET
ncbi:MAG: tetratricopeptide repeat protein [Ignavibacteria bacterium]|nr:tetratricopeptide repeat protein [Ignavibacteria bacterium]